MRWPGKMVLQVVKSAFRKPATEKYPLVKIPMPPRFRGKLAFYSEKCIGCKLCMRDCPSDAIEIVKVGDKLFEARIDMAKCIYCAQCVDTCPKKALEATEDYELAQLTRERLKLTYHAKPASPAKPEEVPAKG